jgi:hypothetical protein
MHTKSTYTDNLGLAAEYIFSNPRTLLGKDAGSGIILLLLKDFNTKLTFYYCWYLG